ncbi:hypothetical protein HYS10_00765, partial [Candidatus Collierbacteria bacterium]|nr:hypothetical protein [Candidatus Collierbacteria bacterium]
NTRDTGSVVVNKEVDTDGDGSYDGNNTTANELGFTWSLDGGQATDMGTSISGVETTTEDVSHSVTEDSPDGYHFTGWFTTDGLYSCEEPEGDSLPVDIEVTKDATTSITFCNARDTGTITIDKVTDPAESQDLFTINLTQGETTIHSSVLGDTTNLEPYTVPTGTYSLTELDASNWLLTDAICTDGEISFDPRQTNVVVGYGSDITCTFTNTAANPELTLTTSNISRYLDSSGSRSRRRSRHDLYRRYRLRRNPRVIQ